MALGLKSLLGEAQPRRRHREGGAPIGDLFTKVDKTVDGDDCDHDCDSCVVHYPKGFKIDESDVLSRPHQGLEHSRAHRHRQD